MDEAIERREELLEKIVDVFLAEGISGLSLRPLSAAVGSSARLLIYHFGSKEELIAVALDRVRSRITKAVGELIELGNTTSLEDFLRVFWKWAIKETNQRYFRLLFEIDGLAMHERSDIVSEKDRLAGVTRWLKIFEGRVERLSDTTDGRQGASTIILSAITGLLHDYFATGDLKRTTAGLNFLILLLSNQASETAGKRNKKGL
jgi:AcrR family transcriptional regulator